MKLSKKLDFFSINAASVFDAVKKLPWNLMGSISTSATPGEAFSQTVEDYMFNQEEEEYPSPELPELNMDTF